MRHTVSFLAVTALVITAVPSHTAIVEQGHSTSQSSLLTQTAQTRRASPARETVWKYQAFLQQQGYDPGPINGIISAKTIAAIQQYRSKADAGDRIAQYHVGVFYAQGIGVPRAPDKAARWYRRAAEQGVTAAQYQLGIMYTKGNGVPRDLIRAYAWHYVAGQGANKNSRRLLSQIEKRLTLPQRQQALKLGKKLVEVCATSKAQ